MAENFDAQTIETVEPDVAVHLQGDVDTVGTDDCLPRNWQIDIKTLTGCMLEVYKNKLWTDITIYCGTNQDQPLKAHKIILAARSPVFEAMLFGPCNEEKNEYTFQDTNTQTFDHLLRYLYNDDADLGNIEEAIDLVQTAHIYQVTSLVDLCVQYLQAKITADNSCKILDVAIMYDKTDLRDACCSFIDRNAKAVLQSEEFLNISSEGLKYILKGDTFWTEEDDIFHRVEDWARRRLNETGKEENGQNIRSVIGDVLYHVRLPTLPMKDIIRSIKGKGYFTTTELEHIIDCQVGNQPRLSFMSNNPRINPTTRIDLDRKTFGFNNIMKSANIYQKLLVHAKRSVHLTSIALPRIDLLLKGQPSENDIVVCPLSPLSEFMSSTPQFDSRQAAAVKVEEPERNSVPESLHLALQVIIQVDMIDYKENFVVEQKSDFTELMLSEPLMLEKQKKPYQLEIEIKPAIACDRIMLISKCGIIDKKSAEWGSKNYISVSQETESMFGIQWIDFVNCSFRENYDCTNDWSELEETSRRLQPFQPSYQW